MGTTGQSITLANSIIGVGILAMPFCFQQCGVLLAGLILLSMGLVSRLCCHFLLKSATIARRRNFEFLAFHVFGSAGKLAVELGIIGFLMGTCIAYFVVVGDLGPQIVAKMFNINQSDILRTSIMVIVSLVCVLPLGLLRNVDSLSNVSAATIGFYLCLVVKVLLEAASQLPSGDWQHKMELWKPSGVLQCVPILSMALFCQTQLFEIFESHPSLSLEKMNVVTKNALNICTCVYFTLGVFGYMAFCSQRISGNILMSLSPTMASDVIKLGFVMSLAFSFPLIIFPCRASIYSLLYKKVHLSQHDNIINHSIPETTFRCITAGIICVALLVSLLIPEIELVLGLLGSTIGVLVCVVFPSACFLNVTFKNTNERVLAKAVLVLGLIIMVLGTYANLQAAEVKLDKYDERYTQERIDKIVEDFFEKRGEKLEIKNEPYIKPIPNKDPSNAILMDSEVQPPNPVPPESNSNEIKNQDAVNGINIVKNENNKLINEVLLPEKIKEDEAADKVSESHPKNLKTKLEEAKLANGNTENKTPEKTDIKANEEIKDEKINLKKQQQLIETMKQHGEEQKELMQEQKEIMAEIIQNKIEEKPKEPSPETKPEPAIPKNKEQQLLDTLKQHGKEQKDILNEIIKTKKEFEENKKVNSNEAQKIAVESIKHIADMAIKSIGGVTEKPVAQNDDKKAVHLEQIANAAVQQIAQKAVETIEAIKEIKQSPDENIPKPGNVEEVNEVKPLDIIDQVINKHIEAKKPGPQQVVDYVNKPIDIQPNANNAPVNNNKDEAPVEINNIAENNKDNLVANSKKETQQTKHSHSPDEPQSYKKGEETQIDTNKPKQIVPLPVLKGLEAIETVKHLKTVKANKDADVNVQRHKREVVDCTKTRSLDPVDKKICKSLLSPDFEKNEVLPKVDLNNAFRPLDPLHHIGRSLKIYDGNKDGE